MAGPRKLTPELIDSLFERVRPPTLEDELTAVARGDKGNAETVGPPGSPYLREFFAQATKAGLSVDRRRFHSEGKELEQLCATRPGEEWRAEVLEWMLQAFQFRSPPTERFDYLQSRILGYTHEQATSWVEMLRHQTPVHGREPIFLFLPIAVAKRVADAKGKLVADPPFTIATPQAFQGGLRRDALDLLPAGFAIGRGALERATLHGFLNGEPHRTLVGECNAANLERLGSGLLSPIDFWDGHRWSELPRASQ